MVKFREGELVRGWANLIPRTFSLAKEKALGTRLGLDLLLSEVSLLLGRSLLSGIYQRPHFFTFLSEIHTFWRWLLSEVGGTILLSLKV